jgi:hypothetical protein
MNRPIHKNPHRPSSSSSNDDDMFFVSLLFIIIIIKENVQQTISLEFIILRRR